MKKILLYVNISLILIFGASCKLNKSSFLAQHVTTEQLTNLEPGMNKDQALTVFSGIYPFDIMMGADAGCEVHIYKYFKPSRKVVPFNLQREEYLNTGRKIYEKSTEALVYYQDGKVVLVSTEGNNGKFNKVIAKRAADLKACAGPVKGSTDPSSLNYNPDATEDDGSAKYCDCGSISNPNYNPKRPLSDCNQPCLKLEVESSEPEEDDCSLCDMIKGGEKVNLNINMNSSDLGSSRKSQKADKSKKNEKPSRLNLKGKADKSGSEPKGGFFKKMFEK
jgi:hypothetical protein